MIEQDICFLCRAGERTDEVCLALKCGKEPGEAKTGYECRIGPDEPVLDAVSRELWRTANVAVAARDVVQQALIRTYGTNGELESVTRVFVARHWINGPHATKECYCEPQWFGSHRALFGEVSDTELVWLTQMIAGIGHRKFDAEIRYPLGSSSPAQVIFKEPSF